MSEYEQDNELIAAVRAEDIDQVKSLISDGIDIDAQGEGGYTALHWAAQYGYTDIVKALMRAGANTNLTDNYARTPLMRANWNGHVDTAEVLADGVPADEAVIDETNQDQEPTTPVNKGKRK